MKGRRDGARGEEYLIRDDEQVLQFFAEHSAGDSVEQYAAAAARGPFWGEDLSALPGFVEQVSAYLRRILDVGMKAAAAELI